MKIFNGLILYFFIPIGLFAQTADFKHDWEMKNLEHGIQFTSRKQAPIPFSTTGEPQTTMLFEASILDNSLKNDLYQIVKGEIEGIKKDISIVEYLENDYQPKENIVTYFDKIGNVQLAFIKYRTNGVKGGQITMPRSVRQILFITNDKLYISTLIVLFADDQENIRCDQITLIKSILKKN